MTTTAPRRRVSRRVRRNRTIAVAAVLALLVVILAISAAVRGAADTSTAAPTNTTPAAVDTAELSIDDPDSLWVVVNKLRPLSPVDYEPADLVDVPVDGVHPPRLRAEASAAVVAMFAAFTAETGKTMQSQSAYRSYASQQSVYAGWVDSLGQKGADLTSARAGFSEHQTGLAIDISALPTECSLDQCFADTEQGTWAAEHAWQYGFTIRYPEGATATTGYEYEPWHLRYVGTALAAQLHESGDTLEQHFGLPAAPTYAG